MANNVYYAYTAIEEARYYNAMEYYDSAAVLFKDNKMYKDALPYYLMSGSYQAAQDMHDSIALHLSSNDDSLFVWQAQLAINLYSNGQSWFDLDSASSDSLKHITQYNLQAGYAAGGIAALLGVLPVSWPLPVIDSNHLDSMIAEIDTSYTSARMANNGWDKKEPIVKDADAEGIFSISPNPTNGNFTISAPEDGKFYLYNMVGQLLQNYSISIGISNFMFPKPLSPGMYLGVFRNVKGSSLKEVKLIYQP